MVNILKSYFGKKIGRNKSTKIQFIIFFLFSVLFLLKTCLAIPVPHGIDGIVYELDGVTPVGNGIDFSVYDTNTGELIIGKTKANGYYSVSLSGNNNDIVIVKVWNRYHSSNRTIILQGVMHNVNLLLNMSIPALPPNITSVPITKAIEDQLYIYDVEADDENDDILEYSLLVHPDRMTIDSETGIIRWVPTNDDVGIHNVVILVSDGIFVVNQSFMLEVINVNDAPEIISGPITSAVEDEEYRYDVEAIDVDNDVLYYYLDKKPDGMQINLTTGLISWVPDNDDVGENNVTVRVSDGNLSTTQSFTINVINTNDKFVINSTPVTIAIEDEPYVYDVDAYDIDGDILNYSLLVYPTGMSINSSTGLIYWVPTNEQVGNHSVIVQVTDGFFYENQSFIISVLNVNDAPNITSTPIKEAYLFRVYKYDVDAVDPDNDDLEYSLLKKPFNMQINKKTGVIRWIPFFRHIGRNEVIVVVSDGNLSAIQAFNITVPFGFYIMGSRGLEGGGNSITQEGFLSVKGNRKETEDVENVLTSEIEGRAKDGGIVDKIMVGNSGFNSFKSNALFEIEELQTKPRGVSAVPKKAYKYLRIGINDTYDIGSFGNMTIFFVVERGWLKDNNASLNDIVLNFYSEDGWKELPTGVYKEDRTDYVYYKSEANNLGYFSVSLRSLKLPNKIVTTGIGEQYIIAGKLFREGIGQSERGTIIRIVNRNNSEEVETITGIGDNDGAYYSIIMGSIGDNIDIIVRYLGKELKTSFILEGDTKDLNLVVSSDGLSIMTDHAIDLDNHLGSWLALGFLLLVGIVYIIKRKHIKKPENRKEYKEAGFYAISIIKSKKSTKKRR